MLQTIGDRGHTTDLNQTSLRPVFSPDKMMRGTHHGGQLPGQKGHTPPSPGTHQQISKTTTASIEKCVERWATGDTSRTTTAGSGDTARADKCWFNGDTPRAAASIAETIFTSAVRGVCCVMEARRLSKGSVAGSAEGADRFQVVVNKNGRLGGLTPCARPKKHFGELPPARRCAGGR